MRKLLAVTSCIKQEELPKKPEQIIGEFQEYRRERIQPVMEENR